MASAALVLLDAESAEWWTSRNPSDPPGTTVFCGSLKAWAVLEQAELDKHACWLGPLGEAEWQSCQRSLDEWLHCLKQVPRPACGEPRGGDLPELLSGDLTSPALVSLALLPCWSRQLASFTSITLPVGRRFRPPHFEQHGDLPLLTLASLLRQQGHRVNPIPVLEGSNGAPSPLHRSWESEPSEASAWLPLGKLRHPEHTIVALEAAGLAVALIEAEPAPALPDLFSDIPRFRWNNATWRRGASAHQASGGELSLPPCPPQGASTRAAAWLESLRQWEPLAAVARSIAQERSDLDAALGREIREHRPALVLVPEENSLAVERLAMAARANGTPLAVLHHTAEVLALHSPLRWQRHLQQGDPLVVPLRGQRRAADGTATAQQPEVLMLDAIRAHLLDAIELEGLLPPPDRRAVGWLHYPLQQQSLLPLADPDCYWAALNTLNADLAEQGVPLRLARKPPLEPRALSDAAAQGLSCHPEILSLPDLLRNSSVLIAPGHLGTGHLEAIARGRPVVVITPERLKRPSLLLEDPSRPPLPCMKAERFADWFCAQTSNGLVELARTQAEWLSQQTVTSCALMEWLSRVGVRQEVRPQRFLGSGLMTARPWLERVETMDRFSRRLRDLRSSPAGRLLRHLRRAAQR